ncbi:leucine zipper putative tumor suppressor 2 homolog [Denticeps clupeoides]|uniref:Leucine zipper putative tumor suppressor 2 homolog n=1 Tax=Denticeps clupeoides TaxID=299321 RepID=A0AAY4ALE2_9TELE|nr:leucine zipper putative tumor suppressor 2 [Denticeps clupeoides]XP_028826001.1 leucine zipper putative tumor suppressor 2 [Denticeps clupeoides]
MALVQPLPVSIDDHTSGVDVKRRPPGPPSPPPSGAMGSVSSLVASRSVHHVRTSLEVGVEHRRPVAPVMGRFQDSAHEALLATPARKQKPLANRTYLTEDYTADWNDNLLTAGSLGSDIDDVRDDPTLGGKSGVPPPKLVPISGKLERNMEKAVLRPTAFKPVVPKSRSNMQYLSPRLGSGLSGSQGNLSLLAPGPGDGGPACSERRSSYSGSRNGLTSQSFTLSDSGRNSLSSLPTYANVGYGLGQGEGPGPHPDPVKAPPSHGHSNSDSGRSSSSKSSGSLGGRGQPLSDGGWSDRPPSQLEAYEALVRELEDKLREREAELQQVRDNLDENEAAICQVYEEKQKRCELEMEELRQSCASKMQQASQKAQRAQQLLQLQVFRLQQEKKKLQEDFGHVLQEREALEERCTSYEREKTQLGPRLEETKWEVCQKSGEISLLKQQLKDLQAELAQRVGEVVTLRGQLREARAELQGCQAQVQEAHTASRTRTLELEVCENELQRRKSEAELLREKLARLDDETGRLRDALSAYVDAPPTRDAQDAQEAGLRDQSDQLRAELAFERQRLAEQASSFEGERRGWEEEKDKVIRYQKQLQQNYVQMYQRNRQLEAALRAMSLELETRDDEGSGNEVTFDDMDDIAATEI